uniref:Giant extracellular hemoglobin linker 1 chain n=1 Tax=Tylorrhynchus heterochetus TaxID=3228785 RepID=GLBL_TYLHE|nr:RecName: Full=Giant extracellular hemoglobin linker 1 chain [Tylorrhynchus heterochaetus]
GALGDRNGDCACDRPSPRGYWGGGMTGRSAFADPHIAEGRLANQDARLGTLEEEVDKLQHKYDDFIAGKTARRERFAQLKDRVWGLEAHHCDDDHLSCKDVAFTCIGHNLVCDGHKDCLNGHDEDEETCSIAASVGSSFEGQIRQLDTCTKRKPSAFRFIITNVDVPKYFPQEPHVKATILMTSSKDGHETQSSLAVDGVYDFTHRKVILYSPDKDNLIFECTFPRHDNNHCKGVMKHSGGDVCLTFTLERID